MITPTAPQLQVILRWSCACGVVLEARGRSEERSLQAAVAQHRRGCVDAL